MINISTNSNDNDTKNIEGFFISFEFITQNTNTMTIDLTNQAFEYSIELISNFTINVNTNNIDTEIFTVNSNSNLFAYIITK